MPFLTIRQAILQGVELFERDAIPVPRLTAEVLLCHAIKRERAYLFAHPEQELKEVEWIHYGRYLNERLSGKPTQYITGRQEFYGREFRVTPAVLIPRPETEHLIEAAIALRRERILDVGTGSGCIAVTLALETAARVTASDYSAAALNVARDNAARLGAAVEFVHADLLTPFAAGSFDLIVSNPPYVPSEEYAHLSREVRDFEPRIAVTPGPTGWEAYERLIGAAAAVLTPDGALALELGFKSEPAVTSLLAAAGFGSIEIVPDLAGISRVAIGRR